MNEWAMTKRRTTKTKNGHSKRKINWICFAKTKAVFMLEHSLKSPCKRVCVCMDIRASALVYNVTSWCVSVYRSVDTIWRKIIFLSLRFVHRGTAFSLCYKVYDVLKHHCIGTEASHPANAIQPMFNVFFSLSIRISCSRDLKLKKDCVCVREREKQRMRLYKCKYIKSVH